ncbi:MAG: polyprenyl synthetase family protein [Planctomycetes bacterium]|nr:polyprenyl synthetase family protein [Planctomycetota bacterium]
MAGMLNLVDTSLPVAVVIDEQLEEVGLILERQLASDLTAVNALCQHIEQYQGKRLRPTLVLLSGLAASNGPYDASSLTNKHRVVAAVVEMIHMATLVHDDVLDEAKIRRKVVTLNHLRGNETAVMLGDYLISNAFHLCSSIYDPAINIALGEVTNTLCAGELLQLHHRDDYDIDEATYFEIVQRKTASLIGQSCYLGAILSCNDEKIANQMRHFGNLLGIAFQVQDDLLDITGDESVVGKSLGKDLDEGKLTLPLIRCLADADDIKRKEVLSLIANRDAANLRRCLIQCKAVEKSQQHASDLVEEAKTQLECLKPSPARDLLQSLAGAVISREF